MTDIAKRGIPPALQKLLADSLEDRLNRLEPHTHRAYNRGIDQFTEWLAANGVEGLSGEDDKALRMPLVLQALKQLGARGGNLLVEGYLSDLLYGEEPYARATVEVRLAALKWAVREAYAAGELTWQLVARMPKPRKGKDGRLLEIGGRKMTGPTPREAIDMLAACRNPRERVIFLMCRIEGYRIHEIRQLNCEDFDGDRVSMVRKKRSNAQVFKLSSSTYEALGVWLEERGDAPGPLFPGKSDGRVSERAMFNSIVRVGENAGVPGMSPHRVRHRACTDIVRYCVGRGIPEEEILRLTGHSSRRALQPYYEHDMTERSVDILDGVNEMYDKDGNLR